jgi:hypothetical protein
MYRYTSQHMLSLAWSTMQLRIISDMFVKRCGLGALLYSTCFVSRDLVAAVAACRRHPLCDILGHTVNEVCASGTTADAVGDLRFIAHVICIRVHNTL